MEFRFDAAFLRNSEVKGILIGLLLGALILGGFYYVKKDIESSQNQEIASIKQEIERLRPPSDTPETNWQRIMREIGDEQKVFWGKRVLLLSYHIPEESWLKTVKLNRDAPKNKRRRGNENEEQGFSVVGSLYTSDNELNLASLGDYILECLDDRDLMNGLMPWQIKSIERSGARTIDFELLSPK